MASCTKMADDMRTSQALLRATPKIRAAAEPSSHRRAVPASETVDSDRLYRLGIRLTPPVTQKFRGKVIFSIDWHQVLDCIRVSSAWQQRKPWDFVVGDFSRLTNREHLIPAETVYLYNLPTG